MKKILVATGNRHKLEEISAIIKQFDLNVELICPKDLNHDSEPIEDGLTFKDNALIKARYYYNLFKMPTIADDSGICIKYFNNLPGIHSARFLGSKSYQERNDYILSLMKDVKNRKASFCCVLAYIDEQGQEKVYEGVIDGVISCSQRGTNGFGYDPIFCYGSNNMTNAELENGSKNEFSHRFIVVRKWANDVNKEF